jgi:hypothetical protein
VSTETYASHVWQVRAGSVKFALSHAVANDQVRASPYPVFARPVWIKDGIRSELSISMNTDEEKGFPWQVAPMEKQMPTAIWGPCNFPSPPPFPPSNHSSLTSSSLWQSLRIAWLTPDRGDREAVANLFAAMLG